MDVDRNKRRTTTAILIVLIVFIVGLGIYGFVRNLNVNPYGDSTAIKNYDQTITVLPQDYKDLFTSTLHDMIAFNYSGDVSVSSINDAIIREDSNKEVVSTDTEHAGSFIVDIPSIKQSYLIQYEYSSNPNQTFTSGYPILVSCVDTSELIYGDFNCKEMYSENFEKFDPIFDILPHSTLDYQISALKDTDKTTLVIDLYISEADQTNKQSAVESYKSKALSWLTSKGFDPKNYTITYSY